MMKLSRKIALLLAILLVAILSSTLIFGTLVSAEDANEATLTVETVNRDSKGQISGTSKVSSKAGSFDSLLSELSLLAPDAETRYTIKLTADAVQTKSATLNIGELAEVRIDLGGHKLQSSTQSAAIALAGVGVFRIDGNYTTLGDRGELVVTSESEFLKISEGSASRADLKNLDISYTAQNFANALGGEVTIRESGISYVGGVSGSIVKASDATVSIKYVDIDASDVTSVLYLSGAKGYIEGGYIYAGTLVESDERTSSALLASVDAENVISFKVGAFETKTYILGAKLDISAALASGSVNADNLVFYYGDGTMVLSGAGADPSAYGIQSNCAFAESDGTYTMSTSSTATAMATTAVLGETPVVTTHSSYVKGMGADGIVRAVKGSAAAPTVGINVLLKDSGVSSNHPISGNEYTSVIIDLNGRTLTWSGTGAKNFNYAGDLHYTFDGSDAEGNVGKMVSYSSHMMLFYPRQASSTGIINEQTVTRVTNTDMVLTNMGAAGSDAFININSGDFFASKISLTYTGETLDSSTTGTSFYMFVFDHDFGPIVNAHLDDVTVKSTYTPDADARKMNVTAINARIASRVWCNNLKIEGVNLGATGPAASSVAFIDSEISCTGQVFSTVTGHLVDTAVTIPNGKLAGVSEGKVYVHTTEGLKTTITTDGSGLVGVYVTDEGYALIPDANNVYRLSDGIDKPSPITFPKIFANGMVFQRGKTINVFGYCDDTNAELKITLGDRVGTASVDENGEFHCELEPMDAAWDLTLTVEQTNHMLENKVVFTDIAVGEVWVMSGQSNAQFQAGYLEDVEEIALLADTVKNVRTYKSTASFTLQPSKYGSGSWDTSVTASNVRSTSSSAVSAIGLATVFRLAAELGPDVPVALIHAARGGSPIVGWIDYETLKELSPSEAKKYEDYAAKGVVDDNARTKIGCCLYNHQIAPYEGYEVAGVMWYQGCSDLTTAKLGTEGKTYTDFFKALESTYRRVFGGDSELPFYVMQLAPYQSTVSNLATFKAQQYDFCAALDNTYLVSTANEGATIAEALFGQGFIHPSRKSPIANRCADSILANEYGMRYTDVYSHANVVSVKASDGKLIVTFDSAPELLFGDTVLGFDVSEDGTNWVSATGYIDGNSVVLSSALAAPKYVRYAYSELYAELYDGTVISAQSAKYDSTARTMTITGNGTTYVISDPNDLIRTMDLGNLTNASGTPMPVFILGLTE